MISRWALPLFFSSTFNDIELPLVIRYHFSPHLSGGGGIYYGTIIGQVQDSATVYTGFPSSGFSHSDFGAVFNVRGNMPLSQNVQAILDVRYLLGIVDLGPYETSQNREMQFLVGASFAI